MKAIFFDKRLDKELKSKGFVKIQIEDTKILENLKNNYENLTPKENKKSYTSFEISSKESKKKIDSAIKKLIIPSISKFLPNYYGVWGNYMIKAPKSQNMELHADWTYVDESNCISLNVWMPLQNTNIRNGTLWVVPYSHKIVKSIRGINLPRFYFKHNKILKSKYGVPINCKKGEAIVYDHRLIHYSYPNFSSKKRLVSTLILAPKNEKIYFYWNNIKLNKIEKYIVTDLDFFLETGFKNPPKEEPIERLNLDIIKDINDNDIESKLKKVPKFKAVYYNLLLNFFQGSMKAFAK